MKNTIIEYLETNKPIILTNNNINKLALNIDINQHQTKYTSQNQL